MKKLSYLLLLFSIVLLNGSCSKDSDSDYYVRIMRNGAWVEYKDVAGEYGPDLGDPSYTNVGIRGQNADASEIMDIAIQVEGSSVPNGTYHSDVFTNYYVIMDILIQSGGSLSNYDISDAPSMPPSKYSFTITSITDDAITGSFTGNYLYDDFATTGTGTMSVTEGEFHVKRIR